MADPVKLKPIKYSVNGKPYYDLSPDVLSGQQEVTDPNEIQTALADYETRVIGGASRAEQAGLRQRLADYRAGTSTQFTLNEKGVLAEPKQIAAQQAQKEAMAADRDVAVGGTFDAPLTVPKGTPNPKTVTYAQSLAGPAGQIPGVAPVDPNAISKRYEEAFNTQKQQGYQTPTDAVGANTMFNQFLPDQSASKVANDFISQDPYLNSTIATYQNYMSQQEQRTSLVDEYSKLLKTSGIEAIDMDLINMKNVIEGTEDDIRTEITKAGGIATDSQVIALSNARNKQLIKNYNTLLETRNSKERYLDTVMNLTQQDRQEADRIFETQMNFGFKIAEINQQMKQNAISTIDRVAQTLGWDGVLQATQGNPQLIAQIERTYGLPTGGLQIAAQRDSQLRMQQQQDVLDKQQQQQFENQLVLDKFEEDKRQFGIDYALQQQKIAADRSSSGVLTNTQMNATINQIAGAFDNEQIVKDFNQATSQYQLMSSLGTQGKSPGDDIAFVYSFAKLMDPGSVVREGEYATIQKYAQSFLDAKTLEAIRLAKNVNFLSADAKQKLLTTAYAKMQVLNTQYQSLSNQYQKRISTVQGGGFNTLPDYSQAFPELISPGGDNLSDDEAWEEYKRQQGISSEQNMSVAPKTNPFTNKHYYQ